MMTPDTPWETDVLIVGGGSAGYSAAIRAKQNGLSVQLIEADKIGGTCLHRGCIPTKALLHAAEIAESVRSAAEFGVRASLDGIDWTSVKNYRDSTVERLYAGLLGLMRHHRIGIITGSAVYTGGRTISVGGMEYSAGSLIWATGSSPRIPAGITLGERIVTSDGALDRASHSNSVIVLGGGVIGVEFASIYASFGSKVTVIEALPKLIAAEDPWSSKQLERAFKQRGIDVRTGTKVEAAEEYGDRVTVRIDDGTQLEADLLLVATGRAPRIDGIGLEENGIRISDGFVATNDRLRTDAEGVFAIGDLVAGPQLAHRGFQHGIFVADEIAGRNPTMVANRDIPRVTYSQPEVASVGLNEDEAERQHGNTVSITYDLAGNAKSQILRTAGGVKVIRTGESAGNGPIVGVHMVGDRVSELIGEAQLAVAWEAVPEEVGRFIHAHPTQHEALGEAMMALAGTPLHAHR